MSAVEAYRNTVMSDVRVHLWKPATGSCIVRIYASAIVLSDLRELYGTLLPGTEMTVWAPEANITENQVTWRVTKHD